MDGGCSQVASEEMSGVTLSANELAKIFLLKVYSQILEYNMFERSLFCYKILNVTIQCINNLLIYIYIYYKNW